MIPKSVRFQLLGHDFRIVRAADKDNDSNGECDSDGGIISIYVDPENRNLYGYAVCHELLHAIFEAAGRSDLSKNETLVEVASGLLWQALRTGVLRGLPLSRNMVHGKGA